MLYLNSPTVLGLSEYTFPPTERNQHGYKSGDLGGQNLRLHSVYFQIPHL
jgi:hypothetical protein